jgi:hypothetical protein
LLGASNVTRSFATLVEAARQIWREPVEILAAMGHGRSYGQDSVVLGRNISGIFPCALWQDLQNRPALPTAALVTDVGNDLMYGLPVEQVLIWVEACLNRLSDVGATTIITQLPIGSLRRLGPARFRAFSKLLFPRSQLTLERAKALAGALNDGLVTLGESRKMPAIPVSEAWYGFDSIHLRRRQERAAWSTLLAPWCAPGEAHQCARPSAWMTAYLACLTPQERAFIGIQRRSKQPCGRLNDGTTISLY